MAAGLELYNDVLNQKGSPALYSDIFANRPAFGYTGRLFISTDTNEIYRDTGTSWVLISSGGGVSTNIYNSDGTLTASRTLNTDGLPLTFTGGTFSGLTFNLNSAASYSRNLMFNTSNVARWGFVVSGAETGSDAGGNFYLKTYTDAGAALLDVMAITRASGELGYTSQKTASAGNQNVCGIYNTSRGTYTLAGTYTGGNPQGALYNIFTYDPRANLTHANSQYVSAYSSIYRFEPAGSASVTMTQATGLRTISPGTNQIQYNVPVAQTLTISHAAGLQLYGIYDLYTGTRGNLTITNAYGLAINSLSEFGYGTLTLTNRWGIYQAGATDTNYFNGNSLFGSTTSTGEKLQVTGTARFTQSTYLATASGSVGVGTATPSYKVDIVENVNNPVVLRIYNPFTGGSNETQVKFQNDTYTMNVGMYSNRSTFNAITAYTGYIYHTNNFAFIIDAPYPLKFAIGSTVESLRFTNTNNICLGTTTDSNGSKTIVINNGTAPSNNISNSFQFYSAAPSAGNASPHFRTEAGDIIKLYKRTAAIASAAFAAGPGAGSSIKTDDTIGGYTVGQIVTALKDIGILA